MVIGEDRSDFRETCRMSATFDGVVTIRLRDAEEPHDAVAFIVVQNAFVLKQNAGHMGHVFIEGVYPHFRRIIGGNAGKTGYIGEEYCDVTDLKSFLGNG